jgi:hypothetical protein
VTNAQTPPLFTGKRESHWAHQRAQQAIDEGDVVRFFCCFTSGGGWPMQLVEWNHRLLADRGLYEVALAYAFTNSKVGNHHLAMWRLEAMFAKADRARLRDAGEPMPDGERFTLYRGVAGKGAARRVRGYSWTDSKQTAAWFAVCAAWFGLADPAVYEAVVDRSDVLFFDDSRGEREYVVRPAKAKRVPMSGDELRAMHARKCEAKQHKHDRFVSGL